MALKKAGLQLTENARIVLERRYLLRDASGKICETPEELFQRVAEAISAPDGKQRRKWAEKYLEMMLSARFIPNSPTLMNAGKKKGQLSACFVLPVHDSLEEIFTTLKSAALIQQSGGGTGFSFSELRPQGSEVSSTAGTAAGPVSFIRVFDAATEAVKQGGTRRGANMAVLRVDHPDVRDFIACKRDGKSISNFNISLGVTDTFMHALESGGKYALIDPRTGKVTEQVSAREFFDEAIAQAWSTGDPGVVFLDRINLFNPTPKLGPMQSTNPCGEQPLLPYESCNLGSLNLSQYYSERGFDWELLKDDTHAAVRFLDNVIDVNVYPVKETRAITLRNRKIGLGVMGFADLLLEMGIAYDADGAFSLGERLMAFIDHHAKAASMSLAKERGAFPNFKGSLWESLGFPKLRNATVTTVAPTGTISIIAGCSSGIEPIFSGMFHRNVLDGERLLDVHPMVEKLMAKAGVKRAQLTDERIAQKLGNAWRPASDILVEAHVRMQAMFQRHSDSAVSKTINLPKSASLQDVAHAYRLAYQLGCKGITIYRDQSKSAQVLEAAPSCPSC
jgi:ribonucleoside-diphosphate reductase alpha chain